MSFLIGLLYFCGFLFFYFLPSIIAKNNHNKNSDAIVIINLFFGWTIIGWILCLAWAFLR